ncbi:MAG: molybdenum cofactor guanylyltransferase [Porticoccaceae bacterium]|nr:MAG: molybdenum cofactor guanylyltransferase [Porticoccaceae bacterium]
MVSSPLVGVVLAGGLGRRLGGDKPAALLAGKPLLAWVAERLAPQVGRLLINPGPAGTPWPELPLPVTPVWDRLPGRPGPLAGVDAALAHLEARSGEGEWLLAVPCDAPFLPADLGARLLAAARAAGRPAACAERGGQPQWAFSLWHRSAARSVADRLAAGDGSLRGVLGALGALRVPWPAEGDDPFADLDLPGDLVWAEELVARMERSGIREPPKKRSSNKA